MTKGRDIFGWFVFAKRKYRETPVPLLVERWGPFSCGVAAAVGTWWMGVSPSSFDRLVEHALPESMTVAAIFAGFQATAQSVLLSMLDSPAWKVLRDRDADERLIDYHWSAIWTLLAYVALCLVVISARAMEFVVAEWVPVYPVLLVAVAVWGAMANWRIVRLMIRLLKNRELPTKRKQGQMPRGGVL